MLIKIDGKEYAVPVSAMQVTLGQRILFDQTHGKELADKLKAILELPEGLDKELEIVEYHCDLANRTLSHFAGIPLELVLQTKTEDVVLVYNECMQSLSREVDLTDSTFGLQNEFTWNNEVWVLAPPELKGDSKMGFGEFLDAKQTVKNMADLGEGNWMALLYLCCVYLRKEGEAYTETLSAADGERFKLMMELPLGIALHVSFFFHDLVRFYMSTSRSFGQQEANQQANLLANT